MRKLELIFIIILISAPAFAQSSNFYEVDKEGRPPSAFSLCCCKKENEDPAQTYYTCKLIEEEKCPEETKQYPSKGIDCPASLMVTRYKVK